MFLFFSNRIGWLASLAISIVLTVLLLMLLGALAVNSQLRAEIAGPRGTPMAAMIESQSLILI